MVVLSASVLAGSSAFATSYPPRMELAAAFQNATVIFEGQVTGCSTPRLARTWARVKALLPWAPVVPPDEETAAAMTRVAFRVERLWKGSQGSEITIATGWGLGGECGSEFERGKRYLVYAREFGGILETDWSFRTTEVDSALPDLEFLAGHTR